jgi:hypothetical protein
MKTILSMLLFLTCSFGVSAQRKVNSEEHNENSNERNEYSHEYHSRSYAVPLISYGLGYNYPYSYYGNPFYGYPYYGYGYPFYSYPLWYKTPHNKNRVMPYKLSLQIQSIKMDYKNKLREARNDKSLSHLQRKQKILSLKTERDQSIINAQRNFIQQGNGNSNHPDNGNTSS